MKRDMELVRQILQKAEARDFEDSEVRAILGANTQRGVPDCADERCRFG